MPASPIWISLALLSAILVPSAAQTWTPCNPLNRTDCPTDLALGTNHTYDFTLSSAGSTWNTTAGNVQYSSETGAAFTIANRGDAPTIQTKFYIFFGEVEVWMKAATGQGIISSIVLQSDDLDEVDWEFTGTNTTYGETNYYGKGNTTAAATRAKWHPVSNPQQGFHNYTTRWTNESIQWFIDGAPVRELKYEDANGGESFPQSPMNVRLGIWAAGDKANNNYTIQWAGGETDYANGPYTMYVKSARITDFTKGKEYRYGDETGSWQSIRVVQGNSTIAETLSKPPPKSVAQRWADISTGGKIAVGASAGAVFLAFIAFSTLCCIRQRRAGRRERAVADAAFEKDTAEMMAIRAERLGAKHEF